MPPGTRRQQKECSKQMITDTVLQATPREELGKNAARRVRANGRIPVSIYGLGESTVAASINARELGAILRSEAGRGAIFTIAIDGGDSSPVKIHVLDVDPVTFKVKHLDLMRLSMTEKTRVSVPLEFVGEAVGIKTGGGTMDVTLHQIEVESLPRDIPSSIQVDISNLDLGEHLKVGDLKVDTDTITIITDAEHLVVGVLAPRVAEETEAAAGEESGSATGEGAESTEPAGE
jgi:large subunit ribosomal protein L25